MKIRHTITIVLDDKINIPEGGAPHECDASAIGLAVDQARRQTHDRFARIVEGEYAIVSVETEEG